MSPEYPWEPSCIHSNGIVGYLPQTGRFGLWKRGSIPPYLNAALQAGLKPSRPDLWHKADGEQLEINSEPFSRFRLIANVQVELQNQAWKKAAAHSHGSGLEQGMPSFEAIRRAIEYLGYTSKPKRSNASPWDCSVTPTRTTLAKQVGAAAVGSEQGQHGTYRVRLSR